jgi:threonine dehydrogenase-like Zn-dependent dehydrogenase
MADTGRVAVFKGPRQEIELREFPLPDVAPGAVLIKVTAANICGSDLHVWRGDMESGRYGSGGSVMGHEMTGRVHRLGEGVATDSLGAPLREGDRVAYPYFYPCRRCAICASGDLYACPHVWETSSALGEFPYFTGAFADYYYLRPGHWVFKVPDELPDELVAPVNCAYSEVTFGLEKAGLKFGESIVIQGVGGLGLFATAVARERGAAKIIAIDGQAARLEMARRMGADETIDLNEYPTPEARVQRVKELTGGLGVDVTMGLVGFASAFVEGVRMVRPAGRYIEIGSISLKDSVPFTPAQIVYGQTHIMGVGLYDPWTIPKVLDFLVRAKNRYPFHEVVSNRYPLSELDRAFRESEWRQEAGSQIAVTRALIAP